MLTMNHVRKIWRGAAVALAVAAPATAHAAGWTPAVEPLGADGGGSTPALAANADGDLVVAGGDGPLTAIRLGGAAFTAPVRVGTGAAQDVHAAINAGGDVAVAWFAGGAVHYAVRPRGGRFGTVHDLPSAGNGIDDVRVGIDDTGEVALAWSGIAHGWPDLHYAVFGPDGATLAAGANDPAKNAGAYFDVAADGDGNVVVAYSETDGTSSTPVAAVRAAGGSTFSVAPLGAGFSGTMPRLDAVLDGAGHAAVAFESSIDDVLEVHAAYAAAGGAFGPELAVSTPGQSSLRPMIGLGARGVVAITWTDPWTMKARVRTGTAGQPFTAPITTFSTRHGPSRRGRRAQRPDGRGLERAGGRRQERLLRGARARRRVRGAGAARAGPLRSCPRPALHTGRDRQPGPCLPGLAERRAPRAHHRRPGRAGGRAAVRRPRRSGPG